MSTANIEEKICTPLNCIVFAKLGFNFENYLLSFCLFVRLSS